MPEGDPKRCKGCGAELATDAHFCPMCGSPSVRIQVDPMIGATVADRYRILSRLGQGGSGTVYLAEHVAVHRKVAVKILHHELAQDELAVERFRREATTVGSLQNEHIVEMIDFGRTPDGRLFLAMEHLEGETVADLIARDGRRPIEQVADVILQLGEALMEAHAMGYIHRDLRPRNLFLARRGGRTDYLKLLDFGLAKLVEKEGEAAATQVGMTFGDPSYMSPEQAHGNPIDRRADIYSMGVIAYEMLLGRPPFTGEKVFDVLTQHLEKPPTPPASLRADVPPWLDALVLCALAKRPEERFVTVFRLVGVLREGRATGRVITSGEASSLSDLAPAGAAAEPTAAPAASAPAALPSGTVQAPMPSSGVSGPSQGSLSTPLSALTPIEAPTSATPGMSGLWYADGEQLASLTATGLQKAAPGVAAALDSEPMYAEEPGKPNTRVIVAAVVGLLLVAVLAIALWPTKKAAKSGEATIDAARVAVEVAAGLDAAIAATAPAVPDTAAPSVAAEQAAAHVPPSAATPVTSRPVGKDEPAPSAAVDFRPRPDAAPATLAAKAASLDVSEADAAQAEFYVKLGQQALRQGDSVGASANFNKARGYNPRSAEAIGGLGQVALQQGYFEDAVVHLKEAARLAPSSPRILTLLGNAYLGSGNAKQAAAQFKRALKIDPDNDAARKGYGEAAAQGGE